MAGVPGLVVLTFGNSVDEGVTVALCIVVVPVPVLGIDVLDGVVADGFTVNEFKALDGTPGVGAAVATGLRAGTGGAGISVFHSRTVYKVASSMCGSMMIWQVPTFVIHLVGGLFKDSCSPFFFFTGFV